MLVGFFCVCVAIFSRLEVGELLLMSFVQVLQWSCYKLIKLAV